MPSQMRKTLRLELLERRDVLAALSLPPVVGAVTDTSAKISVRTDESGTVEIQYTTDPSFATWAVSAPAVTTTEGDFTAIATISGLTAATTYHYRVAIGGVVDQSFSAGTFRTFPVPDAAASFSFAVAADLVDNTELPDVAAPAYQAIAAQNPAFLLQIGDFDHRDPVDLAEMRQMHRDVRSASTRSGADFAANIAPSVPVFHVWDDHDYGPNNSDKTWAQKGSALQAFKEYYPTPALANPNAGIWHKFSYAQADFFMLDLRSQRDPNTDADGPDKSMLDGDGIPNGQKQWLKSELLASTAAWKFIISSVPFNRTSKPTDAWAAFPTERSEIVKFINDNEIEGVIIVSGDMHSGGAIDNGAHSDFPEISVPHTNMITTQKTTGTGGTWSEGLVSGAAGGGFAKITVSTNPDSVVLAAYAADGTLRKSYTVYGELTGFATSVGQTSAEPYDEGRSVAVDASGNSYVAGAFHYSDGNGDNAGATAGDIYIAKLSPAGSLVWQQTLGSTGGDRAYGIALDSANNVYVTGTFSGTVDFNHSSSASTILTSAGGLDAFVLKLSSEGIFQWVRRMGGPSTDVGWDITVDTANNVLTTGQFGSTVDFNPSNSATNNLTSAGSSDIFVQKLSSSGSFVWAKRLGGRGADRGSAIRTDAANQVYTTGSFSGTADFNPSGSATFNLTSAGSTDVFVSRLNSSGAFSLAQRFGGPSGDIAHDIDVDSAGSIYTTGFFRDTADFDPGAAVANFTSAGNADVFISKLSSSGSYQFAKRIGGPDDDRGRGLVLESTGDIAVAGHFGGTVDFDPGLGTAFHTASGAFDAFLVRLDSAGSYAGSQRFGGSAHDVARAIARDAANNLYLTGHYAIAATFDTGTGVVALTSVGGKDIFVVRVVRAAATSPVSSLTQAAPSSGASASPVSWPVHSTSSTARVDAPRQQSGMPAAHVVDAVFAEYTHLLNALQATVFPGLDVARHRVRLGTRGSR